MNYHKIATQLTAFIFDQTKQRGYEAVVVGLSGGIDSAVVAVLCHRAFGRACHAILMPSANSSSHSTKDALRLCEQFDISYHVLPIAAPQMAFAHLLGGADKTRLGNICARLRMIALYDYSSAHHALVVGTSNKTERLLGYGTLYGDLACAINPIGELYKTEIFRLAEYLEIPKQILTKAPSADLYEGQSDEDELGFSYCELDATLWGLEQNKSREQLRKQGASEALIDFVQKRVAQMRFKQHMPEIAQIRKEFDEDYTLFCP